MADPDERKRRLFVIADKVKANCEPDTRKAPSRKSLEAWVRVNFGAAKRTAREYIQDLVDVGILLEDHSAEGGPILWHKTVVPDDVREAIAKGADRAGPRLDKFTEDLKL